MIGKNEAEMVAGTGARKRLVDLDLAEAWAKYLVAEATSLPGELGATDAWMDLRELLAEHIAKYGMHGGAAAVEAWPYVDEHFEHCLQDGIALTLADVVDWRNGAVNAVRRE